MQIIFHIDLNAFFASAEIARNPKLQGKPVVVSRDSRRSIITTASYEARKFGIHSAMPLFKAKELCPNLIAIEPHFDLYKDLSQQFFNIVSSFSPLLEVASIDECYVDMTEYIQLNHLDPRVAAKLIQEAVYNQLYLQCSIGIAPNKFLAKMASDMKKPLGITMLTHSNYKEKLWPLPISDMFGIGIKTYPKLEELGIKTIGDLAKQENYTKIKPIFKKNALLYYYRANGKDFSKLNLARNELKSIGNSTTFENDSNDEVFIKQKFKDLSFEVSTRAKRRNVVSNSISIQIKYSREHSKSKQTIIQQFTNDFEVIYSTALYLFDSIYNGEQIRLVGVTLNNVSHLNDVTNQISLFDKETKNNKNNKNVDHLIKTLNESLDSPALIKASSLIENNDIQSKYIKNDKN